MTEQQFTDKYRHQLAGMMLDCLTSKAKGAELALQVGQIMGKVDAILRKQWADLQVELIPTEMPRADSKPRLAR